MEKEYVSIKNLVLKSETAEYPNGANSPTVVARYTCPCGAGEVVERNVVGFHDRTVTLECAECEKELHSFVDIVGLEFVFYHKESKNGKI